MMEEKIKICFDKEYKIRVMDPVKFKRSEELDVECSAFMESKYMKPNMFFVWIVLMIRVLWLCRNWKF